MAQLNDTARIVILHFEDLSTQVFFGHIKNSTAFRHDLDINYSMFEHCVPGLVYWSSAPWKGLCTHSASEIPLNCEEYRANRPQAVLPACLVQLESHSASEILTLDE